MAPQKPKARIGRPPRAGKAANERIELNVTSEERRAWERAAGDQSLASWIREACEERLKRAARAKKGGTR